MCTLLFAWRVDAAAPLIVAANRDEFYARPTAPAQRWADAPRVFAGRDLLAGGTWLGVAVGAALGVAPGGRFAALTNVREPSVPAPADARSRGQLVADFLRGEQGPAEYLAGLDAAAYPGFNLVVADPRALWYLSNRSGPPRALDPGVYGISNAGLDTPWPKVVRGRERLAALVAAGAATTGALLDLLADRAPANDAELPDTGVGLALERMLSPLCIVGPEYGTRSSTALRIARDGTVEFHERSLGPPGPRDVAVTLAPG